MPRLRRRSHGAYAITRGLLRSRATARIAEIAAEPARVSRILTGQAISAPTTRIPERTARDRHPAERAASPNGPAVADPDRARTALDIRPQRPLGAPPDRSRR